MYVSAFIVLILVIELFGTMHTRVRIAGYIVGNSGEEPEGWRRLTSGGSYVLANPLKSRTIDLHYQNNLHLLTTR